MRKKVNSVEIFNDHFKVSVDDTIKIVNKDYFIDFINNHTGDERFKNFNISKDNFYKICKAWNCFKVDPNFSFNNNGFISFGKKYSKDDLIDYYKTHNIYDTEKHFNIGWRRLLKLVNLWDINKTSEDILLTIKNTNLERYGVEHWVNSEKAKNTLIKNFGSLDAAYKYIIKKGENTKLQRYGNEHYRNDEKIFNTINDKYGMHYFKTTEFIKKAQESKKRNNSYGRSRPEEILFILLKDKYGSENVITQYKDERYPFNCDFYIKSEDKFIELNSYWTHGPEEFNINNKNHRDIVSLWEERSKYSKLYKSALYVWTILDPLKIETAKKNNLNYEIIRYKIVKNEIIFTNGLSYNYKKYYKNNK